MSAWRPPYLVAGAEDGADAGFGADCGGVEVGAEGAGAAGALTGPGPPPPPDARAPPPRAGREGRGGGGGPRRTHRPGLAHHRGRALAAQERQAEGGDREEERDRRRDLPEQRRRPHGAEHGLTTGAAT